MMIETVNFEIERQLDDLKKKKKEGEVRGALESGKSEFLRPIPGEARMYPETDLPLLKVSKDKINLLKRELPKMRHEIRDELKKKGVSDEMINLVIDNLDEFNTLMKVYSKDPQLVAKMVTIWRQELATKLNTSLKEVTDKIGERTLERLLELVKEGKLDKSQLRGVFNDIMQGVLFEDAVKKEKVDDNKLEEEIARIVKEKPGLRANAYMGLVIQKLGANVDKRKAMEILNRIVK